MTGFLVPRNDLSHDSNRLLASLSGGELRRLREHFELVQLPMRQVLYEANQPIEHVYFLHRGVASLVRDMQEGATVEIATIGNEGVVGVALVLGGSHMTSRAFMQVPGEATRIACRPFLNALEATPGLRKRLTRYALALFAQVSLTAACNRAHSVEQRCARWLLMTHDRVEGDTFPLTQEFLGLMLGVQRPTVSIAAGMLQKAGLISYSRGIINIIARRGLEKMSCECYRVIAAEYEQVYE